jgi:hypothetical protein
MDAFQTTRISKLYSRSLDTSSIPPKFPGLRLLALCCLPGGLSSDVLQRHAEHSGASAGAFLPTSFETENVCVR